MKSRLLVKLIASMGLVVILGGAVSAFTIGFSTKRAFRSLVRENDIGLSRTLAGAFEDYYRREGDWSGVERLLRSPGAMMQLDGAMQRQNMHGSMMPRMGRSDRPGATQLLLSDEEGEVIARTSDDFSSEKIGKSELGGGTPLVVEGERVGYLFIGSMLNPVLGPFQRAYLFNVYRSIVLSTLLVALVAIAVAALLFRHIISPLRELSRATAMMRGGNYEVDVATERSDEIGVLSNSFQEMAVSLKEADEWKRRLIADSAHELRTPVSLLQGNLEMIREGIYPADETHIEGLYEETLLLSRLVGELRDLADAEAGKRSYTFEAFSLRTLITQLIHSFRAESEAKRLDLKMEATSGEFEVFADRHKLSQAFSNIISNALRYSPEQGTVKLSLFENDRFVEAAVEDSGAGIEPQEREKIFERFYRTDSARNRATGGSGLGLAVSKEILEAHGGRISAENPRELNGARILVQLPKAGSTGTE